MRRQWHPLLAQSPLEKGVRGLSLREDYSDRLEIKDSLKLGRMPSKLFLFLKEKV
jgi:hypothetical protein